jgi:hypothetical protein
MSPIVKGDCETVHRNKHKVDSGDHEQKKWFLHQEEIKQKDREVLNQMVSRMIVKIQEAVQQWRE